MLTPVKNLRNTSSPKAARGRQGYLAFRFLDLRSAWRPAYWQIGSEERSFSNLTKELGGRTEDDGCSFRRSKPPQCTTPTDHPFTITQPSYHQGAGTPSHIPGGNKVIHVPLFNGLLRLGRVYSQHELLRGEPACR